MVPMMIRQSGMAPKPSGGHTLRRKKNGKLRIDTFIETRGCNQFASTSVIPLPKTVNGQSHRDQKRDGHGSNDDPAEWYGPKAKWWPHSSTQEEWKAQDRYLH